MDYGVYIYIESYQQSIQIIIKQQFQLPLFSCDHQLTSKENTELDAKIN